MLRIEDKTRFAIEAAEALGKLYLNSLSEDTERYRAFVKECFNDIYNINEPNNSLTQNTLNELYNRAMTALNNNDNN